MYKYCEYYTHNTMNIQIISLLEQLWLNEIQSQIFIYLYSHGPKPASAVARNIGGERTNTYKLIETMIRHGYISETTIKSTKQFYIADKNVLRNQIEHQKKQLIEKEQVLPELEQELSKLDQERISPLPAMRFYQWKSDIELIVKDMIQQIDKQQLKMIRIFSTNTLESQVEQITLEYYASPFIQFLSTQRIHTEIHLANGILLLEHMSIDHEIEILRSLPAGQNSLMIIIIWNISYILLFKHQPAGIKIESPELSEVLKFFLKIPTK